MPVAAVQPDESVTLTTTVQVRHAGIEEGIYGGVIRVDMMQHHQQFYGYSIDVPEEYVVPDDEFHQANITVEAHGPNVNSTTGHHRAAMGPTSAPAEFWRTDFGELDVLTGPILHDGLVYIGTRGDPRHQGPFHLHAFDATTGETRWTRNIDRGLFSPAVPAAVDGTVYVRVPHLSATSVEALDAADGSRRWEQQVGDTVVGSFVVTDDQLVVTMAEALAVLDTETGEQLWETAVEPIPVQPAVGDGAVHVGCKDGFVRAFDTATGEQQWRYEFGDDIEVAPAVRDGRVYAGTDRYMSALRNGDEAWRFEVDGEDRFTGEAPAVDDKRVYLGGSLGLYALGAETGETRWTHELEHAALNAPSVAGQTLVVGQNRSVTAFDVANGSRRWRVDGPRRPAGRIAVADGRLYATHTHGTLFAYATEGGDD